MLRRVYTAPVVILFTLFLVIAILPAHPSVTVSAVSDGERLSMFVKPAVVKIYVGPIGAFYYHPPNWKTGKVYQVSYVASGSGFFVNPTGYIITNAHVTQEHHDGEEKQKEHLFRMLLRQVAADYKLDPRNLTRENVNFVAEHSRLTEFQMIHHVVIPDGSPYPFEIKSYGAPAGEGENWKDVSLIKIEVKNAPTLVFGDSDSMQLQDHVTVVGYPGAADSSDANMLSRKSQLEASITDGKISARKSTEGGAPVLQISAPTSHGNSGGPVLNDSNQVIGLLTFRGDTVFGQEVQGFNFVVTSNTAKEFLGGVTNQTGPADQSYREGLEYYWKQEFKNAITKFEEVQRLFPQHSEVGHLIQSSQQGITDGKDKSGISAGWVVGGVLLVLFLIVAVIIIAGVIFLLMRRKGKTKSQPQAGSGVSGRGREAAGGSAARPGATASQQPNPNTTRPASGKAAFPQFSPQVPDGIDRSATIDLSRTVAIPPQSDTAPISYGSIKFVSGVLSGQKFDVTPEGCAIGRDSSSSQIVIADPRISKRHVWVGVRSGRVVIEDQSSRNGTFLNDPKSERVTENALSDGDTVILGESDVARFEYRK